MRRQILGVLFLIILISCTSTKKSLDPWLGSIKQQLILRWGPPVRTVSDGGTGEILVYADQGNHPGVNGIGAFTFWDCKYMYADRSGKIYHWLRKRETIPPTHIDAIIYRR